MLAAEVEIESVTHLGIFANAARTGSEMDFNVRTVMRLAFTNKSPVNKSNVEEERTNVGSKDVLAQGSFPWKRMLDLESRFGY